MGFTFGSDPEFMLVGKNGHKSAIGIVPGSKNQKYRIGDYCYYYDNVLAECNIVPASCKSEAVENIRTALQQYVDIVFPHGVRLAAQAAQKFPRQELQTKEALHVGCKSESCAYELIGEVDPRPLQRKFVKSTLRTAGGHIHLGTPLGRDYVSCISLVRMLDLFVGIPSLYIDNDPTTTERRKLYGNPGRYRRPSHGVEYRTLSNFWLASPQLVGLIYDLCEHTVDFVEQGRHCEFWEIDQETLDSENFWNHGGDPRTCHRCHGYDVKLLRNCFKTGNRKMAWPLMNLVEKHLTPSLRKDIVKESSWTYDLYSAWGLKC
jgi:hypothetical protein